MKTIEDLKQMIKEPASKEWFAKHGTSHSAPSHPKAKALHKATIVGSNLWIKQNPNSPQAKKAKEEHSKMKESMSKVPHKILSENEKRDYQHRTGRGYHE